MEHIKQLDDPILAILSSWIVYRFCGTGSVSKLPVETSTFSMEFIASKVCLEAIKRLCFFKLRCFRIPMEKREPTYFSNNGSEVKSTTNVESTLNEKPSSITYPLPMICDRWYHNCLTHQYTWQLDWLFYEVTVVHNHLFGGGWTFSRGELDHIDVCLIICFPIGGDQMKPTVFRYYRTCHSDELLLATSSHSGRHANLFISHSKSSLLFCLHLLERS